MKEIIQKTIHLARLRFPPGEVDRLAQKVQDVLRYVEKLKTLDTSGIEATSHAVESSDCFREDEIRRFPAPEKILGNAPSREGDLFEVPKVIE